MRARPPPGPDGRSSRRASAADLLGRYLDVQADAVIVADPKVRQDLPDSVHKMRVACRRIRSLLRTFRPMFEPGRAAELDGELRWIAGELGEVRDREVQLERLLAATASLRPDLVLGPVPARIEATLLPELVAARKRLLVAMRSARYRGLLELLDRFVTEPPYTDVASATARDVLRPRVRKAYRSLRRRVEAARAAGEGAPRDAANHRARKAAKRLRYAAEALRDDVGADAKRLAKRAEDLQELLGEYQDGVVSRGLLRDLGIRAHAAEGESAFTFGILLGLEQSRADDAHLALDGAWEQLSRPRNRRWLR